MGRESFITVLVYLPQHQRNGESVLGQVSEVSTVLSAVPVLRVDVGSGFLLTLGSLEPSEIVLLLESQNESCRWSQHGRQDQW